MSINFSILSNYSKNHVQLRRFILIIVLWGPTSRLEFARHRLVGLEPGLDGEMIPSRKRMVILVSAITVGWALGGAARAAETNSSRQVAASIETLGAKVQGDPGHRSGGPLNMGYLAVRQEVRELFRVVGLVSNESTVTETTPGRTCPTS